MDDNKQGRREREREGGWIVRPIRPRTHIQSGKKGKQTFPGTGDNDKPFIALNNTTSHMFS
jgi:hypothetical protein